MPRAALSSLPPDSLPDSLRRAIAQLDGHGLAPAVPRLGFGIAAIDAHLGGGLSTCALHEFAALPGDHAHAAAATHLLAILLAPHARARGPVLWVCAQPDLYPPGLAAAGFDTARLIVAETAAARIPSVMEEALRHPGLSAVIGETGTALGLTASRRLHLAAEKARRPVFLLRRFAIPPEPSAAVTRWRVGPLPTAPTTRLSAFWLDPPRWRLDLLRCRSAPLASWTLDCHDDLTADHPTHRLALAPALADRPVAAPRPALRRRPA